MSSLGVKQPSSTPSSDRFCCWVLVLLVTGLKKINSWSKDIAWSLTIIIILLNLGKILHSNIVINHFGSFNKPNVNFDRYEGFLTQNVLNIAKCPQAQLAPIPAFPRSEPTSFRNNVFFKEQKFLKEQAGAELCQAQGKLRLVGL